MKKIYVMFIFLLGLVIGGSIFQYQVKAEGGETPSPIIITIDETKATTFEVGSEKPDFKSYFEVKINEEVHEIADEELNEGGFDINVAGSYQITVTITFEEETESKSLEVHVVEKGDTGPISITSEANLPLDFIVNSTKPDLNKYFVIKEGNNIVKIPTEGEEANPRIEVTSDFDITKVGTYTITVKYSKEVIEKPEDTQTHSVTLNVIEKDTTAPEVIKSYKFHNKANVEIDGSEREVTPWDSQVDMAMLMASFELYDRVDGRITITQDMFEGIEKVKTDQYGNVYSVSINFKDKAGNNVHFGDFNLYIVNTIGRVLVEVNEDLPVEFIINTEAPDFRNYFTVSDNGIDKEFTVRMGGFNISKEGTYRVSVIYQRQFVFRNDRDRGSAEIEAKVILRDETAPEITTFRIDDQLNDLGQLPWTYQQSLDIFISRFTVKDNVDGKIEVTRDMFKGIDEVDINTINKAYTVTFEVTDKAGNKATKEVTLWVLDDVNPFLTNFQNRYYSIGSKINILELVKEVGIQDNYDNSDNVIRILISSNDIFQKLDMAYHDELKNKDRFTPEELANAAKAYRYVLSNFKTDEKGNLILDEDNKPVELDEKEFTVYIKAFKNNNTNELIYNGEFTLVVVNDNGVYQIKNLYELHTALGIDQDDNLIQYYVTNFEENKNGEFVVAAYGLDTSNNKADIRQFRIVIENGPSLGLIILIVNAVAIGVFAIAIGAFLGIRKARLRKES